MTNEFTQYFSSFLLPLGTSEDILQKYFSTPSYDLINASKFGGSEFGKAIVAHTEVLLLPGPVPTEKDRLQPEVAYEVYQDVNSLVGLCTPFTNTLRDLHECDPGLAENMLHEAVNNFRSNKKVIPSILCHSLFVTLPISSPLFPMLMGFMRKNNIKYCNHCAQEMEEYCIFLTTNQDAIHPQWRSSTGFSHAACGQVRSKRSSQTRPGSSFQCSTLPPFWSSS